MTPPAWTALTRAHPGGLAHRRWNVPCAALRQVCRPVLGKPLIMLETQGPREEQRLLGWALSSSHTIHHVLTLGRVTTQGVRTPTWTCRSSTQSANVGGLRERREQAFDARRDAAGDCAQRGRERAHRDWACAACSIPYLSSRQKPCGLGSIFRTFKTRKLTLRQLKEPGEGHRACLWPSEDSNPAPLHPEAKQHKQHACRKMSAGRQGGTWEKHRLRGPRALNSMLGDSGQVTHVL